MNKVLFQAVFQRVTEKLLESMGETEVPEMTRKSFRVNRFLTDQRIIKIQAEILTELFTKIDKLKEEKKRVEHDFRVTYFQVQGLKKEVELGRKGNVHDTNTDKDIGGEAAGEKSTLRDQNVQNEGSLPGASDIGMGFQRGDREILWGRSSTAL